MAERVKNFQISDRAKLGIAGVVAVFVAAFLGALLALAIDGNGDDHGFHGPPEFGMVAGGPGAQFGAVPGGPSQGGGFPGAPGGTPQGGVPVPPTGGFQGVPDGQAAPPSLPAIPTQPNTGNNDNGSPGSGQGHSN